MKIALTTSIAVRLRVRNIIESGTGALSVGKPYSRKSKTARRSKAVLEIIGDLLIIAFGVVTLFIFTAIQVTGGYIAIEPNSLVLWGEILMGVVFVAIGINRFLDDLRR